MNIDKHPFSRTLLVSLMIVSLISQVHAQQTNVTIQHVQPEAVGISSERLDRLHALMQKEVDDKRLPGIVTILVRHGKIVEEKTYGKKDVASGTPMTNDTIFRIFSMTKVVTGVAMMILYEQGKWRPSEPIAKYIPEFAHLKVLKKIDPNGTTLVEEPAHAPTMGELMTNTAGFGRDGINVRRASSLQDMVSGLAKVPLAYQPGTRWIYGVSQDIQGYIVERLSGQSFPDFLQKNVFAPLGMKDTAFYVPKEKRNRFATNYVVNERRELLPEGSQDASYAVPPAAPSGGAGLASTAEDYLRFAQMLLNGGELDGVRLLAPATVRLMTSNHIGPNLMTGEFYIGPEVMRLGSGWGYDCAVVYDPAQADTIVGKGTFFWWGGTSPWFWADPTNDLIFIGLTQRQYILGEDPSFYPYMEEESRPAVYQALVNPTK